MASIAFRFAVVVIQAPRIRRDAIPLPAIKRDHQRILDRLLGNIEVTNHANQRRHNAAVLLTEYLIDSLVRRAHLSEWLHENPAGTRDAWRTTTLTNSTIAIAPNFFSGSTHPQRLPQRARGPGAAGLSVKREGPPTRGPLSFTARVWTLQVSTTSRPPIEIRRSGLDAIPFRAADTGTG
jgi:hypothetical protein